MLLPAHKSLLLTMLAMGKPIDFSVKALKMDEKAVERLVEEFNKIKPE